MFLIISAHRSNRTAVINSRKTTQLYSFLVGMHDVINIQMCVGKWQGVKEISYRCEIDNWHTIQTIVNTARNVYGQECVMVYNDLTQLAAFLPSEVDPMADRIKWTHDVSIVGATKRGEDYTDLLDGRYITLKERHE